MTETYEAACAVSPVFRQCGAVALLSGDVATALRLLRIGAHGRLPGRPECQGAQGTQAAPTAPRRPGWARHPSARSTPSPRLGRAVRARTGAAARRRRDRRAPRARVRAAAPGGPAPRRAGPRPGHPRLPDGQVGGRGRRLEALGGRAQAVLGAGPRGPVTVDLAAEGPHLLIEGPPGSGRTELLRALVASLASAERPDRLGIVLIDGRDGVSSGGGQGEGLRVCTDVPHVTTHLTANDPVRMREFALSLSAELEAARRAARTVGLHRVAHRAGGVGPDGHPAHGSGRGRPRGDIGHRGRRLSPSSTLRLRPGAARRRARPCRHCRALSWSWTTSTRSSPPARLARGPLWGR
ncbi:hypothetical protein LV779_04650 [Streptomyces thinghirensis]|nr:hypothetical protein [Streptomyces thinghirensis]